MDSIAPTDQIVSIETRMEQRERAIPPTGIPSVREAEQRFAAAKAELGEARTLNALVGSMPPPLTAAERLARIETVAVCATRVREATAAKRDAERDLKLARAASQPWDRQRLWEAGW